MKLLFGKYILAVLVCFSSLVALCQKNDTIILVDKSRHIGEINSLRYGKLSYATRFMGTVRITWTNIDQIMSPKELTIQMADGNIYHGRLIRAPQNFHFNLVTEADTLLIPMGSAVEMAPVKKRKIFRITGSISFGLSYIKATDITQINLASNVGYRTDRYNLSLTTNSINTFKGRDEDALKQDLTFNISRYVSSRFLVPGYVALERNTETGIDLRTIYGIGVGANVIQRPRHRLNLNVMPTFNNEQFFQRSDTISESGRNSYEASTGLNWKAYNFSLPELDFVASARYFQTITNKEDEQRSRFISDMSISYELIDDVFLTVTFYSTFDSRPPEGASRSDYGTTLGVRYGFKGGQRAKRRKKDR